MMNYKTMTHPQQTVLHRFTQITSKAAYSELVNSGVVGVQEVAYLELLRTSPNGVTDAEASKVLMLPCSTVSARRNGIMQKHSAHIDRFGGGSLIVSIGHRKNESGKSAIVWQLSRSVKA